MRRAALLSLLLAVAAAAPAHAATTVKRYTAWTEEGDPTIKRYYHGSAECEQASQVSSRDDAWRCTSGTIVLDPCFLSPTDEEVLCVTAPWARRGHLLGALIEPERHGSSSAPDAWALRVGRRRCTYMSGPSPRTGPTYRCTGRRFLFGLPNRRRATWTIRIGKNRSGRHSRVARIRTAWT